MSVAEMERRFYELKGKLDLGAIGEEEFKSEVEKLRFQDSQNRWWMIGAQSGRWYMYDGVRWIPGPPPQDMLPPPPPPASVPTPPVVAPNPRPAAPQPKPLPPQPAPIPIAPMPPKRTVTAELQSATEGSRRERRRTPLRSPVPIPFLLGCAALLGICLVAGALVALENMVPGRPVSAVIAKLPGNPSKLPARTPTPSAAEINAAQVVAMGDSLVLQSQFESAIDQYQAATQLAPGSSTALTHWSRASAMRGQLQDGLAKAHQATQRSPNDAEAQAQLARIQAWLGQTDQAIAAGERAVELDPKNGNVHAMLAEVYLSARRAPEAQSQAQVAVQLAPQSGAAHRAQAWVFTVAGQREVALGEWRETLVLEPNLSYAHFEFGEALRLFFKDPAQAADQYRQATLLYGAYIPAYSGLGLALLDANQPEQAIAPLQRAVTLDPDNANNYAYLGLAFGMANRCNQAIPYFQRALARDANNPLATKGLSECRAGTLSGPPPPAVPAVPPPPPTVPASATSSPPVLSIPTTPSNQP